MMKFLVFVLSWEFVILIVLTRPVLALRPRISRYFMVSSALVRSLFLRLELSSQKGTAQVRTQCIRTTHSWLMYAFDWWNGVMCCNHSFSWSHISLTACALYCRRTMFWGCVLKFKPVLDRSLFGSYARWKCGTARICQPAPPYASYAAMISSVRRATAANLQQPHATAEWNIRTDECKTVSWTMLRILCGQFQ